MYLWLGWRDHFSAMLGSSCLLVGLVKFRIATRLQVVVAARSPVRSDRVELAAAGLDNLSDLRVGRIVVGLGLVLVLQEAAENAVQVARIQLLWLERSGRAAGGGGVGGWAWALGVGVVLEAAVARDHVEAAEGAVGTAVGGGSEGAGAALLAFVTNNYDI